MWDWCRRCRFFCSRLLAGHVADLYPRKRVAILAQLAFCACSLVLALLSAYAAHPLFVLCLPVLRQHGAGVRQSGAGGAAAADRAAGSVDQRDLVGYVHSAHCGDVGRGDGRLAARVCAPCRHRVSDYGGIWASSARCCSARCPMSRSRTSAREPATWKTLIAGIAYIRHTHIILATITLDLFAVLLGGATTLMPIYARDILHVGPGGLGWLRAAPSAGALVMALSLAHLRPFRFPGKAMLWAVAGFGVATIVFGFSRSMPLSLAALFWRGRAGHGQRGRAANARADSDAQRHARARERGQQRVHQQFQRDRRLRVGRGRAIDVARVLRRQRRCRHDCRGCRGGPPLARPVPLPATKIRHTISTKTRIHLILQMQAGVRLSAAN